MTNELVGLMNNTKWREFFSIVKDFPVYLQLQEIEDIDFHMDHEQSDWILSGIANDNVVYVCRRVDYKNIYAVRICKSEIPPSSSANIINLVIELTKDIGKLETFEDNESFEIYGYQ